MTDTPAHLTVRIVLHHRTAASSRHSSVPATKAPSARLVWIVAVVLLAWLGWRYLQPVEELVQARPAIALLAPSVAVAIPAENEPPIAVAQALPVVETPAVSAPALIVEPPQELPGEPVIDAEVSVQQTQQSALEPPAERLLPTRVLSSRVQRFQLATGVRGREPVGMPDKLLADTSNTATIKLYAFSEVLDMQGLTLKYHWILNDQLQAAIEVRVGSARWRSFSSKNIGRDMRGSWRVELRSGAGELLAETVFQY